LNSQKEGQKVNKNILNRHTRETKGFGDRSGKTPLDQEEKKISSLFCRRSETDLCFDSPTTDQLVKRPQKNENWVFRTTHKISSFSEDEED
jgi:hypothetical protein